jgi:V-type H+-transporting ATPase subunit a
MNDVIAPLQLITNTYGVPSYQEANPATFAIVTFPFLFAVMFGDYGHGSLIFFVGAMMVLFYDNLLPMLGKDVMQQRYMFFLMGFFSCYNGLLYNEWFAMPYPWFKSCYVTSPLPKAENGNVFPYVDFTSRADAQTDKYYDTECVYPFGMDPTWFLDANDILVVQNSMKMKISVIIGVMHMSMGVVTKGLNAIYFKDNLKFWTEVVTGMIILNGLFGWMDLLIVIKWLYPMNPYSTDPDMKDKINQCPSIITIMINNFLLMGKQPFVLPSGEEKMVYLFEGQRAISETLVVLVIISMPIMLFVKPCSGCFCPEAAGMHQYVKHDDPLPSGPVNPDQPPSDMVINTKSGGDEAVQADMDAYQQLLNQEKEGGHHNIDLNELFIH